MAKEPTKQEQRRDSEQEVFMREVDEAVRQDEAGEFAKKYGWPIGGTLFVGLLAFGGYLFWQSESEKTLEEGSELYIAALDELEAGNNDVADGELSLIAEGDSASAAVIAKMTRAGIALEEGRNADAATLFGEIADDVEAPQELRDLARLREVTAAFDTMEPQAVIDRLGALANEDSAYYGNATELIAHAYLVQEKPEEAGPLLVAVAQDEDSPESLRARARQLAGLLGFDPIEDVEETMADLGAGEPPVPAQ